jgi:hypothetical protein
LSFAVAYVLELCKTRAKRRGVSQSRGVDAEVIENK